MIPVQIIVTSIRPAARPPKTQPVAGLPLAGAGPRRGAALSGRRRQVLVVATGFWMGPDRGT
jgi:hypothetical protein